MRFVKFKSNNAGIIAGKEYKIESETEKEICFIDENDEIDVRPKSGSNFEVIDRPVMVKAWDDDNKHPQELELVHDLGEEFDYRYVCKDKVGGIDAWKNIEYLNLIKEEVKLTDIELLQKEVSLLKHDFQLMSIDMKEVLRQLNEKLQ